MNDILNTIVREGGTRSSTGTNTVLVAVTRRGHVTYNINDGWVYACRWVSETLAQKLVAEHSSPIGQREW